MAGSAPKTVVRPDNQSQDYINRLRQHALREVEGIMSGGPYFAGPVVQNEADVRSIVEQFYNPFIGNVETALGDRYDQIRAMASRDSRAEATRAGSFGSRRGILEGTRLGEIDRAEGEQVAQLRAGAYNQALHTGLGQAEHNRQLSERQMQEPLWRAQNILQLLNLGMGPTGQQYTQRGGGNPLGQGLGGALAASAYTGNPFAIGGAGLVGILSGLFG